MAVDVTQFCFKWCKVGACDGSYWCVSRGPVALLVLVDGAGFFALPLQG